MPLVIAVDAMGGDHAPAAIVDGCVQAIAAHPHNIVLVGRREAIAAELARHGIPAAGNERISVVDARDVIEMHEPAVIAIRQKKHSSIRVACHLVREGTAQAVISAGNTGAVMVTAKVVMGTLHGIERPAVMASLPSLKGRSVWLDVGANVQPRPEHLYQFGIMGEIYAREILQVESPRVGILSIGEEDSKGNSITKDAAALLRGSGLNFVGNVEGRDIFNGSTDVIVSDGFTGNVSLKAIESVAEMLAVLLKQEISSSWSSRLGYLFARRAFASFKKRVDYAEYGGMPLLGVRGGAIICHGRSSPKAIMNAVRVAAEVVQHRVDDRIQDVLARRHQMQAV